MATQQPVDQGKAFETKQEQTHHLLVMIYWISAKILFGEVDDY